MNVCVANIALMAQSLLEAEGQEGTETTNKMNDTPKESERTNLCAMSTKHQQVWCNAIWKSNWNICVRYFNVKYNYVRLWFECALNWLFERSFSSQFFFANWSRAPRLKNSKLLSSQRQLVASWKKKWKKDKNKTRRKEWKCVVN